MPYDAMMMAAAVTELSRTVVGGRIQRIGQPERLELILHVYTREGMRRVAISADSARARLHLSDREKANPPTPPPFCLVLRKRIEGARIETVRQVQWERVAIIELSTHDELGTPRRLRLIVETMGRHSNVILVNEEGKVVDALKRIGSAENRYREVLPGEKYVPPPPAGKIDPDRVDAEALRSLLAARGLPEPGLPLIDGAADRIAEVLWKDVRGLGPELAREIVARAVAAMAAQGIPAEGLPGADEGFLAALARALTEIIAPALGLAPFAPRAYLDADGSVAAFSAIPLARPLGMSVRPFTSAGELLDFVFGRAERLARFRQTRDNLLRAVEAAQARVARRAEAQRGELARASNFQRDLAYGELIKQNLHRLKPGTTEFTAVDYADPEQRQVTVPLDPHLTPVENAQRYFKRYARGKKTVAAATPRLAATEAELRYLEGVAASLTMLNPPGGPSPDDEAALEEIRSELLNSGYVQADPVAGGRTNGRPGRVGSAAARDVGAPATSSPLPFMTSSGKEVLVGRNNRQNDLLTFKIARPDDLWLHVKDAPGSHVILRRDPAADFAEADIVEAAMLAAYHSRSRHSSRVPVDYTTRSHVRKPPGARPGMVIYDHQRTVYVTPETTEVERLRPRPG